MGVARRGQGGQSSAVERSLEREDVVGALAADLAPLAGHLDRPLIGLGSAVAEEDSARKGALRQHGGQLDLGLREIEVAGVD